MRHWCEWLGAFMLVGASLCAEEDPQAFCKPCRVGAILGYGGHNEWGMDKSKGSYSANYQTPLAQLLAEFHYHPEFYVRAAAGGARLTALSVNGTAQPMEHRVQYHLLLSGYAFYQAWPHLALASGLSYLYETTMYLHDRPVPESAFHHLFWDFAGEVRAPVVPSLDAVFGVVLGINTLPGRRHTYLPWDLLHLRWQLHAGAVFALF
ncbi:MAG: hypothetical protein N2Z22_03900 [Turneriella sp.]|nr:hypothetical protein [Turneriella sp.]